MLDTRPALFIAYMALKELNVDDKANVEVILRHPGAKYLEERLFGVGCYDTSAATTKVEVEDRKDAFVPRLRCE